MARPPRPPEAPLIDRTLVVRMVIVSVMMAGGTFGLFFYALWAGETVETARTAAVNVIVFFEVFYLFNTRYLSASALQGQMLSGNPTILSGIGVIVVLQMLFTYWPAMHVLFYTAPLDAGMWLHIAGLSIALFLLVEMEKAMTRTRTS